jgi:cyclopropane fatty-acyl-phospholipid synthase-like methyltransferase
MLMNDPASGTGTASGGVTGRASVYKRDFWSQENLKFSEPWYRLDKSAQLISKLTRGQPGRLLDVGCGPGTMARVLPPGLEYYGIDLAIHEPAPNLRETDLVESPIAFGDLRFDIVIAQGFFEYVGSAQSQKFAEIAQLLTDGGRFIATYTNFRHRKKVIYEAFSNVRSIADFRQDLERHFTVDRVFPASHNWKHGQPARKLVKAANMRVSANIPVLSPILAVEYYFVCSPLSAPAA